MTESWTDTRALLQIEVSKHTDNIGNFHDDSSMLAVGFRAHPPGRRCAGWTAARSQLTHEACCRLRCQSTHTVEDTYMTR